LFLTMPAGGMASTCLLTIAVAVVVDKNTKKKERLSHDIHTLTFLDPSSN